MTDRTDGGRKGGREGAREGGWEGEGEEVRECESPINIYIALLQLTFYSANKSTTYYYYDLTLFYTLYYYHLVTNDFRAAADEVFARQSCRLIDTLRTHRI